MTLQTVNDINFFGGSIEGYKVADQATNSGDADINYFGFVNRLGEWYIMKQDTTAGANNLQTYRFAKGGSGYTTNWTNRESLTYDYFYTTFA